MTTWGTSRNFPARFEVGQDSESLYARLKVRQDSAELLGNAIIRNIGYAEILGKFEVGQDFVGLLGKFEAQATAELLGKFEVGQDSVELLGNAEIQQSDSAELLGNAIIRNIGYAEFLGKFEVGQGSAELPGKFEIGQGSAELLSKIEVGQGSAELPGKFETQATAELFGKFEAQATAELFSKFDVGQGSQNLLGKFEAQATAELLGKFEAQATAELLGKFEVGQDSVELLGNAEIQQSDSAELLGNAIIRNIGYAEFLGKFEVGQDFVGLLGKFEAQATADLLGKFEAQVTADLLGRFEVGQGSAELLGKGIIKNVNSADLLGKFEAQATAEFLSKVIIIHPAYPVWLFGKFEIEQVSAELLGREIIRHSDTAEFLGCAVIRHVGTPVELLGNAIIRQPGYAELLGKTEVQRSGFAELLCGFVTQSFGDLKARMKIGPAKDSDTYFSFWDPSDWINEVIGIGQGFITIPWVEADSVVKTVGTSSARLTSTSAPDQYKEIRFGWGGMNWGFEAAISPEVAPTPIDTDGRGPRRGSRAERDQRREVPQSSYKDLAGLFVTQAINDLRASFFAMVNYTSWTLAWTRDYGAAVLLDGVYVDNSGNCYITDEINQDVYFRSYAGVETSRSDYGYMIARREELPVAISEGEIRYVVGENELVFDQFDIWRDGAIVASINPVTDLGADFDGWRAMDMSASGKYIAFVVEGLSNKYYVMLYEGS